MSTSRFEMRDIEEHATRPEDGFLGRWSRRKAEARQAPTVQSDRAPDAATAPGKVEAEHDPPTALTDADMPPLETLGPDSDYSMFWSSGVSDALRQAALRKLFHAPQFNKVCLCAEYADDYTNFTPLGDVVPHDLRRMLAREAERALAGSDDDPECIDDGAVVGQRQPGTAAVRDHPQHADYDNTARKEDDDQGEGHGDVMKA